jgi:hypothetical protein
MCISVYVYFRQLQTGSTGLDLTYSLHLMFRFYTSETVCQITWCLTVEGYRTVRHSAPIYSASSNCKTFIKIDKLLKHVCAHPLLTFKTLPVTWCTNSLTFNNCTFCPHCIYVFCIYLRTNSDLCHLQHKLTGFYNRDEKCLLRGTNWVFK